MNGWIRVMTQVCSGAWYARECWELVNTYGAGVSHGCEWCSVDGRSGFRGVVEVVEARGCLGRLIDHVANVTTGTGDGGDAWHLELPAGRLSYCGRVT